MRIGLVVHAGRDASRAAAETAAHLLEELGVDLRVAAPENPASSATDREAVASGGSPESVAEDPPFVANAEWVDGNAFADGLDLAISFGGDGTFLRAAHLCRDASVPVLGVNIGRLGFLAEVELEHLAEALRAVAKGRFATEPRATLQLGLADSSGDEIGAGWALNEVSVEKTARQRLLVMDVYVDDELFARVPADALVIATSTGSTAYALSAGGPIVSPGIEATLVVPVAPHSLFDRTLVSAPDETVRVVLAEDQAPAVVSCDGRTPVVVEPGGQIIVRGGGSPVQLAGVDPMPFHRLIRRKFGLR